MSAQHESKGAIYAAFAANMGIAVSKFIAFSITGASSLLAEAFHSVADSSNQILLLLGSRKSRQKPSRTHPFGYGRAHYLYAFIVSIVLFSLGGLFALYEGIHKIQNPATLESPIVAYIVLIVAMFLEGFALRTAMNEARSFKPKNQSWWQFLRRTKSVNHVVLTMEDSAALIGLCFAFTGVVLSSVTNNPIWDAIGTLMIGALLIVVACILFVEVKSLLIGEAVDISTERKMRKIISSASGVEHLVDLKTLYVGPVELFVAMKITVNANDSAKIVATTIDEVEAKLRSEFPYAKLIYIEPDIFRSKSQQRSHDKLYSEKYKKA